MESVGKAAIRILREKLADSADGLEFADVPGGLQILAPDEDSFPVTIEDEGDQATVVAGEWHEHLTDPSQAAHCAMWLLTPYYRIVEMYRDEELLTSYLERYFEGDWHPYGSLYFTEPDVLQTANRKLIRQQAVLRPPDGVLPEGDLDEEGFPPDSHIGIRVEDVDQPVWFSAEDLSEEDQALNRASDTRDPLNRLYDVLVHDTSEYSVEVGDDRIKVVPSRPDTFQVELRREGSDWNIITPTCSYWTDSEDDAFWFAINLIGGFSRVVVGYWNGIKVGSWIETYFDHGWSDQGPRIPAGWWSKLLRPNRFIQSQQKLPTELVFTVDEGESPADLGFDDEGYPLDSYWGTREVRG